MTTPPEGPDTRAAVSDEEIASGVICMMCGVAGSGKTTFARRLEARGMVRLSMDEEIWSKFGGYGVDYPPERYGQYQVIAGRNLELELKKLMEVGIPTVLDYSFWKRSERDRYRALIEGFDRPWKLIVLRVAPETARRRLAARSIRFDANASFPVTDELLDAYFRSFEWPQGEGEIDACGVRPRAPDD